MLLPLFGLVRGSIGEYQPFYMQIPTFSSYNINVASKLALGALAQPAMSSDRLTATTRTRTSTARILFMSPPGQRETVGTGRDHPGDRGDRPPT